MTAVDCYIEGCEYTTPEVSDAAGAVMLAHHLSTTHPAPATAKAPPIPHPRVSQRIHEDNWDCFMRGLSKLLTKNVDLLTTFLA